MKDCQRPECKLCFLNSAGKNCLVHFDYESAVSASLSSACMCLSAHAHHSPKSGESGYLSKLSVNVSP